MNTSITRIVKPVIALYMRYSMVTFIVLVVCGLIASVLTLAGILNRPYDNASTNNTTTNGQVAPAFDEQTINRLSTLETSDKNTTYQTMPPGRNNPFAE